MEKMRLIRKDYAQDIVVNESKKHSGFEFCYKPVYDKITDCVEVDAIPIEWIKEWTKKQWKECMPIDTIRLVIDWKEENAE